MTLTILPCPFCANDDVEIEDLAMNEYAVTCPECRAIGPILDTTVMEAISYWNDRRGASTPAAAGTDPIVESVRKKFLARSQAGIEKYGQTLDRADLTRREWLIHAQEEAMDLANYLEVLIQGETE